MAVNGSVSSAETRGIWVPCGGGWAVGGGGVGVGSNLADDFRDVIAASRFMCLTSHKLMYRAFDVELLFWCLFCLHCSELFFVFFVVVLVCIL